MNLVSIKSLNEVVLQGVTLDWVKEDKSVKEIIIRDAAGAGLHIKMGPSYSETLRVLVPKPFEDAERFVLSGVFLGLTPVNKVFEHEHEANAALEEFKDAAGYGKETGLTIEKKKMRVDEDGATVDGNGASVVVGDPSIPF